MARCARLSVLSVRRRFFLRWQDYVEEAIMERRKLAIASIHRKKRLLVSSVRRREKLGADWAFEKYRLWKIKVTLDLVHFMVKIVFCRKTLSIPAIPQFTVQLWLYSLSVLFSECHEWFTAPISASLRRGSLGYFRSKCCIAGAST